MCCPANKVIKSMYSDVLAPAVVPYQAFTTVLCGYRVGVLERRYASPFKNKFGLTSYRKYPPRSLVWNLFSQGIIYEEYSTIYD